MRNWEQVFFIQFWFWLFISKYSRYRKLLVDSGLSRKESKRNKKQDLGVRYQRIGCRGSNSGSKSLSLKDWQCAFGKNGTVGA
jgi:hypothetical protein